MMSRYRELSVKCEVCESLLIWVDFAAVSLAEDRKKTWASPAASLAAFSPKLAERKVLRQSESSCVGAIVRSQDYT